MVILPKSRFPKLDGLERIFLGATGISQQSTVMVCTLKNTLKSARVGYIDQKTKIRMYSQMG